MIIFVIGVLILNMVLIAVLWGYSEYLENKHKIDLDFYTALEQRVYEAIDFVETEYNTYPSAEEWRKALIEILKGESKEK